MNRTVNGSNSPSMSTAEAVEPVSELFARYGFNEGVAIDEPYVQDGDGDNLEIDLSKQFTVRTYVADGDFSPELIEEIRQALWHYGRLRSVSELRVSTLKEEDWANAWKEHFQVAPDRRARRDSPALARLRTSRRPGCGRARSGNGVRHRFAPIDQDCPCSVWSRWCNRGDRVFDVGTGSGILAIAALKLGAVQADCVDVETVAVRATRENAERNGVTAGLRLNSAAPVQASRSRENTTWFWRTSSPGS